MADIDEIKITSLQQYLECVFKVAEKNEDFTVLGERFYFRGQADSRWDIIPAIGRGRAAVCHYSILNEERNLIETAKFKLPQIFKEDLMPLDLLAKLQHHGIPTRLLDITFNPLVALFFACNTMQDREGEVIIFYENKTDDANYPIIHAICESYKFAFTTWRGLNNFFADIIEQPYFIEQKNQMKGEKNGADWIKQCCEELLIVKSKSFMERQRLQQGAYIIFNNEIVPDGESYAFDKIIKPISKEHKNIKSIIRIEAESKSEIMTQLKLLGISEETLFADNSDIVCKSIVQEFSAIH